MNSKFFRNLITGAEIYCCSLFARKKRDTLI